MLLGKKVRLREYRQEDIVLAQEYLNDPDVKQFLMPGIPLPITAWDEEKFIKSITFKNENYTFAMETLEEGQYIGGCGIHDVDWKNSHLEVGIFIGDKRFWGKGYGTDAMNVLLEFIFEEMNINRARLEVYDFNKRAIKSYEKCGFKLEGTLRQEMYRFGKYHDIHVMGILKEEWIARNWK